MPGIVKERLYTPGPTPLLIEAQARTLSAPAAWEEDAHVCIG
jgi:hypothetical protein